ncbi:MAG: AMP-binding protein [Lachnospiraceae bacterium]|nr:AMP-binding protein [Lachnospiraceae bacterium]
MIVKAEVEKGKSAEQAIELAERYSGSTGLEPKDRLHLRLIAEETAEIIENLPDNREGTLSIEGDGSGCAVRLMLMQASRISASETEEDRAPEGIMSKIGRILGLSYETIEKGATGLADIGLRKAAPKDFEEMGLDFTGAAYVWTEEAYNRASFDRLIEDDAANWIEISHSIIANLSDDIRVFVFEDHSELTIHVPFWKSKGKKVGKYPLDPELIPLTKIPVAKTRFQIKMVKLLYGRLPDRQASTDKVQVDKMKIPCESSPKGYVSLLKFTPAEKKGPEPLPAVLFMHGGAFMLPALPYHYRLARKIVEKTGSVVFFLLQHLGPKYSLPLPIKEAYEVLKYLIAGADELKIDAKRIAAMGDSSGGTMTAALSLLARDNGTPLAGQLLLYPSIGLDTETKSMKEFTDVPVVNADAIRSYHRLLKTDDGAQKYYLHPASAASLENLPPAYVETAEFDALRDEGIAYAEMLKENGCEVVLNKTKGTVHAFDMAKDSAVLAAAMDKRMEFINRVFNKTEEKGMGSEEIRTIRDLLESSVSAYPERIALRYEREDDLVYDISYERFGELCRIVGAFVNEKRTEWGRRVKVGMFGSAGAHYISVLTGVMASGNTVVPLDAQMDLSHLSDCLNRSDVDILFYDWEQEPLIKDAKGLCPKVREYYSLQSVKKNPCLNDILRDTRFGGKSWGEEGAEASVSPEDLAMILFTSGTTGRGKGVMLTNSNLAGNVLGQNPVDDPEPVVSLLTLPIHHVYCINADVLTMIHKGATICINGPLSQLGKHLRMFEPSVIYLVPMIARALYNRIAAMVDADPGMTERDALYQVYGRRLSRIVCGGGGLPQDLAEKYAAMGVLIGQGYGMSECSPIISQAEYGRIEKLSSAGKLLSAVEARIAEGGEIQVRSPYVMQGYYNEPELTKEAFTEDGWLKTGDIGYLDEEGFLYLTGRLKNLIILSNGENIAPEELESALSADPLISEILVFGEDDVIKCEVFPDYGNAQNAGVKNIELEIEEHIKAYNQKLPPYKRILQTSFRKAPFQKTSSKKIIREAFFRERKEAKEQKANIRLPENEGQEKVYEAVANVLGHRKFGIDTDLYTSGLDSFTSILLLTELQDSLDFALTLTELMENASVEKLALLKEKKAGEAGGTDYTKRETYPLTRQQMYFAYVLKGNTTANLPFFYKLSDRIDLDRMEKAIRQLFEIHPILSDRIEPGAEGRYANFRCDTLEPEIERLTLSDEEWEEKRKTLLRPFMYTKGENLYHIGLYRTEGAKYLFFDVAHIIGDGMTMSILLEDLNRLYLGEEVKKSSYSFYEFILDEYARDAAGLRDKDIEFYEKLLKDLNMSRSVLAKSDSYDLGKAHNAFIKGRFSTINRKNLQGFCSEHSVSENAAFITAFSYTAALFWALDDVVITSIHNGRTDGRWVRIAGQFYANYAFRYKKIPHETVGELLKRNADQILHTMETHMSCLLANEMFFQYQGELLNIPQIGGESAEGIRVQLDSMPFHMMVYAGKDDYTYELRYWENRFDRDMLLVFLTAMENILKAMFEETSVRKLKDHLAAKLYPEHLSMSAQRLNASIGYEVIPGAEEDQIIKPYVLDEYGLKKPFGAWGRLYILNRPVNGCKETIESLYTPGILYDTGIEARITPDHKVEALYQAGRTVVRETIMGRSYINLFELERTLEGFPGIEKAEVSLEYGENNLFYVKAALKCPADIDKEKIKAYVAEKLGKYMTPEIITIKS